MLTIIILFIALGISLYYFIVGSVTLYYELQSRNKHTQNINQINNSIKQLNKYKRNK